MQYSIFISGATGKMGRLLQTLIQADSQLRLSTTLSAQDVVIDFSHPAATLSLLEKAQALSCPLVIGTTGFNEKEMQVIRAAAQSIPILLSFNMSAGIALMKQLVAQAAAALGVASDVEIIEKHHHHKVDAPSGTALLLGEAVAKARGQSFDEVKVLSRSGETGQRVPGSIGFASIRAGDIVGEHTVLFASQGEVLEVKHTSFTREHYAKGALTAALWLKNQSAGLYSMDDIYTQNP